MALKEVLVNELGAHEHGRYLIVGGNSLLAVSTQVVAEELLGLFKRAQQLRREGSQKLLAGEGARSSAGPLSSRSFYGVFLCCFSNFLFAFWSCLVSFCFFPLSLSFLPLSPIALLLFV